MLLGRILSAVFADPDFRTAEAAWRGLATLTRQGPFPLGDGLRFRIVPACADTLAEALDLLGRELAVAPPNLILVALPFDSSPRSLALLEGRPLAPTPFSRRSSWNWLRPSSTCRPGRISSPGFPTCPATWRTRHSPEWRRLPEHPGGAWLAATCNPFAGREPHRSELGHGLAACDETEPLWLSPAWAIGALAAQSVARFGWPTHLAKWRQVALHGLPGIDTGDRPIPTAVAFPRERLQQFKAAGISPLAVEPGRAEAFLPHAVTVSGQRLEPALYLNRVVAFLIQLHEAAGTLPSEAVADEVADALALLFAAAGGGAPAELSVKAAAAAPDGSIPLYIRLVPPVGVLQSVEPLEFTFAW